MTSEDHAGTLAEKQAAMRIRQSRPRTSVEDIAARLWTQYGWSYLKVGWPDLLLWRYDSEGKLELRFREIKAVGDKLRPEQGKVLDLLKEAGLDVGVRYEGIHFSRKELLVPRNDVEQQMYVKSLQKWFRNDVDVKSLQNWKRFRR